MTNKGLEALQKLRNLVEYLTRIDYVPRELRDEVKELLIIIYLFSFSISSKRSLTHSLTALMISSIV